MICRRGFFGTVTGLAAWLGVKRLASPVTGSVGLTLDEPGTIHVEIYIDGGLNERELRAHVDKYVVPTLYKVLDL